MDKIILDIGHLLSIKINNLVIHSIPLSDSWLTSYMRYAGKIYQPLIHPSLSFTLSHIAIQLNLENTDVMIIEYGQYLTKDSDIKNGIAFSGSKSSANPRKDANENSYYYINKDGVRITKIDKEKYDIKENSVEEMNKIISKIIASEHYNIPYKEFNFSILKKGIFNGFHKIECEVKNKITLGELINNFKDEKWEAKNYNLMTHNCQTFGAEVIKVLKAIRVNERDKIRTKEKMILPNCIIKALWDNEDLSAVNTLGRIPVIGLGFDLFAGIFVRNKKK